MLILVVMLDLLRVKIKIQKINPKKGVVNEQRLFYFYSPAKLSKINNATTTHSKNVTGTRASTR